MSGPRSESAAHPQVPNSKNIPPRRLDDKNRFDGIPNTLNEAQLASITAAEIKKVKLIMPDDKDCLTRDFFELFMAVSEAQKLMDLLDPGNLGSVTSKMFVKGVLHIYRARKQIVHSLEAQREIESTFRRVCSYAFTFSCLLILLVVVGVSPNMIIVTGATVLTAVSIILSKRNTLFVSMGLVSGVMYTDFLQSTILIVFLNPYRIGDRVRIDGEAQYVRRISTYFTEFESIHGRIVSGKEIHTSCAAIYST